MVTKLLIRATFDKTNSYSLTGKTLNISRQRVHQVIKNYYNFGRKGKRNKLYDLIWKETCEKCSINPSVALHHKDNNNLNDTLSNLISVCLRCHYLLHTLPSKKSTCPVCNRTFISKGEKKLCDACLKYKRNPNRVTIIRKHEILERCTLCNHRFDTNVYKYHSRNICIYCFEHTPARMEYKRVKAKEWYLKQKGKRMFIRS